MVPKDLFTDVLLPTPNKPVDVVLYPPTTTVSVTFLTTD